MDNYFVLAASSEAPKAIEKHGETPGRRSKRQGRSADLHRMARCSRSGLAVRHALPSHRDLALAAPTHVHHVAHHVNVAPGASHHGRADLGNAAWLMGRLEDSTASRA